MKFKLVNIGPIKDAEIELGDFTIFLGNPSEISFVLRSIYTSLVLLSKRYEKFFEQKFYEMLDKAPLTGVDYVISYLQDLIKDGYNICDPKVVEESISIASEYEIRGEVNENCEIRIYENVSRIINDFLSEVKNKIKEDYMRILTKNVNYTNPSAIYINGKEIMEFPNELNIEKVKGEMSVTSTIRIKYELSEDGILKVELKANKSKLRLTSLLKQDESVISPFLLGVKKYFDSVRIKEDLIYIPSFKIAEDCKSKFVYMTDLGEMFVSCYPAKDLPIQHYIIHLNNLKRGAKNRYILDLISKVNEEMRETLLPLADSETPALALVEGVNNADLLLVLPSLVQYGYKVVIGTDNEFLNKKKIIEQIKSGQKPLPVKGAEKTLKEKDIRAYRFENGTAIPVLDTETS